MGLLKSNLITLTGGSSVSPADPTLKLDLEFSSMTALPASITFARASIGTYFDQNGALQTALANAARFDHDPVTLEPLGLLIEEGRTNLQRYSQDFSQWTATLCTIAPAAALDGTTSATNIIPDNTVNTHRLASQASTVNTTSTYTVSFYAKKGAANFVSLSGAGAYNYCAWNLDTGTLAGNGTPWTNPRIQACGNGWYRCYANCIFIGTAVNIQIYGALTVNAAGQPGAAAGDGVAPWITIWGVQIELGSFPTSYVPTTTATVPRAFDSAFMTGTNLTSWYTENVGTFAARIRVTPPPTSSFPGVVGKSSNSRWLYFNFTPGTGVSVYDAGTALAQTPVPVGNTTYNIASACDPATSLKRIANNGVAKEGAYNNTMDPAATDMNIGSYGTFVRLNGPIASLKYWNVAKTAAELQEITNPAKY